MVYRGEELATETREHMRGGKNSVAVTHIEKALLPKSARLFARLSLPPGSSIGEHRHTGEAEMFYFLRGEGVVTDDGERIPVRAGDAMTTPSGHSHSVENTGTEDLVLIASIVTA